MIARAFCLPAIRLVSPRPVTLRCAAVLALLAVAASSAPAQEVGKASAVNPAATANMRVINIGASISHKERIRTEAKGAVQLLFVDKTSMTIGPNSDLVIDEYVYDPRAGSGKLAATLSKGALRFVGGQISHSGDAEIKTANAVIGIRGGVALIGVQHVFAGYGSSTVTSGGATVVLGAGEYTETQGGGAPPSPPGSPPPGFVLGQIQLFQSGAGQTGGTSQGAASQTNVARAEVRATGTPGGSVAGPLNPTPPPQTIAPLTTGNAAISNLTQTVQTSAQSGVAETIAQDLRPAVTLSGWFAGLDRWLMGPQVFMNTIKGNLQIVLDPTSNRVQADISGIVVDVNNPRSVDAHGRFGSLDLSRPADSTYTNYDNFSARAAEGDIGGYPVTGSLTSVSRATAQQVATAMGAPGLTICQCDYTRWGIWEIQATSSYCDAEPERMFGTWVAGRSIGISEVPTTGRATYIGHVVANVQDIAPDHYGRPAIAGDPRLVGGNFSNTVDFGARTGSVSVAGLDRTNYAGTVSFLHDPRLFAGTLQGDYGNRQIGLSGSFFRGTTSPVGEMGGSVLISGSNYIGGGIFAAKMR